ncbi:hypothetical protein D3C77_356760 [compost metagenome]
MNRIPNLLVHIHLHILAFVTMPRSVGCGMLWPIQSLVKAWLAYLYMQVVPDSPLSEVAFEIRLRYRMWFG